MRRRLARFPLRLSLTTIVAVVSFATTLMAQDRPRGDWDVTLGAGAAVRPTYEGSDRYFASPVPFANVTWRDTVSLGVDGLSAYARLADLRIGGGLTYGFGRKQGSGIFQQGDDRLYGMGDIPAALGLKGFAEYKLGPAVLNASVTKFTAGGNDGVLVNFGVALPYRLNAATTVTARVSANWADDNYMQTYFGVTPWQSANSGYAQYRAGASIKDVGFGLGVRHMFDRNWGILVDARVTRLTGDAENSPIVFSKTNAMGLMALTYRF